MASKAERTTQFIIETVAPVFNKHGYIGTSMSDIVAATGLTKGAIYGNFKNKEDLALAAFNHNLKQVMGAIARKIEAATTPLEKIKALIDFYRSYHEFTIPFGGCPILNVGIDANHQNPPLMERVMEVIQKLQASIVLIVEAGIKNKDFRADADAKGFARKLFSITEGAIFMTMTMNNSRYLLDATDVLEQMLISDLL